MTMAGKSAMVMEMIRGVSRSGGFVLDQKDRKYAEMRRAYLAKKRRNRQIRRITRIIGLLALLVIIGVLLVQFLGGKNKTTNEIVTGTPTAPLPTKATTPSPTPTPTPSPTPTPTPLPKVVSMVAVGDNLYDWDMLEDGYRGDGKFDFSGYYDNIAPYAKMADFAVINQETVLGGDGGYVGSDYEQQYIGSRTRWGSYHGYSTFNTPNEAAIEFMKAGFNVVTSATNHTSDHGIKALHATLDFWKNYPVITVLGIHDSQASQDTVTILEKYGIKIAVMNYTYGLNITTAVKEEPYSIDLLNETKVKRDVEIAKAQADFVVVFVHWGTEYSLSVSGYQKDWAKKFASYGVDVVVGAHPHICETMEIMDRPDGGKMAVYYSLGNFISIFKSADCELEGMAYIEFYKDGDTKYIKESTVIPLVNHYNYDSSRFRQRCHFTVYALQDYTEELAKSHGCLKYGDGKGFSLSSMQTLANKLWAGHIKLVTPERLSDVAKR